MVNKYDIHISRVLRAGLWFIEHRPKRPICEPWKVFGELYQRAADRFRLTSAERALLPHAVAGQRYGYRGAEAIEKGMEIREQMRKRWEGS